MLETPGLQSYWCCDHRTARRGHGLDTAKRNFQRLSWLSHRVLTAHRSL
ncbi:hypothetical protein BZL30_6576 [Mycobacterium kansasii]|uniref:Uncharacterized protein n=1 Tax=Mycobacterium kansasii TaxID=1768 RepID=A0A1V3WU34_MYCKA|nr:hypothetical protein BZL30_6576 [Mycobacterium kansasii]